MISEITIHKREDGSYICLGDGEFVPLGWSQKQESEWRYVCTTAEVNGQKRYCGVPVNRAAMKEIKPDELDRLIRVRAQIHFEVMEIAHQEQHEDSYWDDPLRGTNKC